MRWPSVTALGVSLIICVFGACNGGGSATLPTAPSAPIVPPPALPPINGERSDWISDATLLSCSGDASICSRYTVGQIFSDQRWSITRSDTAIDLNYELERSYRGTVDGRRFVATYVSSFNGNTLATLEGEFAEDGNSFEAVETSAEFQRVWRHRAVRIQ